MSRVTRWFPPHVKPVHIGAYETLRFEFYPRVLFSWWDGEQWLMDSWYNEYPSQDGISGYQNRLWRGLKEKPE